MSIKRDANGLYRIRGPKSESDILAVAADIFYRRMERLGQLSSPGQSTDFLRMRLAGHPYEVFGCVFLDTRHRVLAFEELFRGTVDGASVHPREVVPRCLHHNAAAVVFSHNHPSGTAEPSAADRAITQRLSEALALIDVRVIDHIVVSAGDTVSLAQRGWI